MSQSEHPLSATHHTKFGKRLRNINDREHIPSRWLETPIEQFIRAHNFDEPVKAAKSPQLLIVSCIEYRFRPEVPAKFAYVMRTAGGKISQLPGAEFALSYILANGVRHIALVGHNDCGMTKVHEFKPKLVAALIEQGWDPAHAGVFIEDNAERFAMDDEIDSLEREFNRLKALFKNVEIAPLFISLSSTRLHIPKWYFTE